MHKCVAKFVTRVDRLILRNRQGDNEKGKASNNLSQLPMSNSDKGEKAEKVRPEASPTVSKPKRRQPEP